MGATNIFLAFASFFIWKNLALFAAAQRTPDDTGRICPKGSFETGSDCQKCPRGTYTDVENAFQCTRCPPFKTSEQGSSSKRECMSCNPGRFFEKTLSGGVCRICPEDTYSDPKDAMTCTPCPPGTFAPKGSGSKDVCKGCSPGRFIVRRKSLTFLACRTCPLGQTTFTPNAMEGDCRDCPPGQFRNRLSPISGECELCRVGTFAKEPGMMKCSPCPRGLYQNEIGAATCNKCPEGSTTGREGGKTCRPTCDPSSKGCISCPPGEGYNNAKKRCEICPDGSISPARSSTPCYPCPVGQGSVNAAKTKCVCDPGFRLRKNGLCEKCRSGFSNEDGSNCMCVLMERIDDCLCPPLTKEKNNRCVPCELFEPGCEFCPGGQFYNRTARRCETCPRNTFNNIEKTACNPCPDDSTSKPGSRFCICEKGKGLKRGKCEICPPGKISDGFNAECRPCFDDTFNDEFGASKCKKCPAGQVPVNGATSCSGPCPPGARRFFFEPRKCSCMSGYVSMGRGENLTCTKCGPNEQLKRNKCICPSKMLGGPGKSQCLPCGKNERATGKGCQCDCGFQRVNGKCEPCPRGTEGGSLCSGVCTPCEPGEVAPKKGMRFCDECAPFQEAFEGIICLKRCPSGSFRNARKKCVSCRPGQRVLNRTCVDCIDSVSPGGAVAVCTRCEGNKVPNMDKSSCIDP